MNKEKDSYRDEIRDSNDPEITRRVYQLIKPEWLAPNVRLKLQHFLPKEIPVTVTEQEYTVYLHTFNEKMEVYSFVHLLFEEHNAVAHQSRKFRSMYIESSYLFCMDITESTMSSNFFLLIPKSYYRRYLDDVPVLYSTKACIIVDYHRHLAYRFGVCISKTTDEAGARSEDRLSLAESSTADWASVHGIGTDKKRKGADGLLFEDKQCTMEEIMAINRLVHLKRSDDDQ